MNWHSLDIIGKVLIPTATFVLGVVVTLVTKRIEKRRSEIKERVTAIARLVNGWYNQLHQLSVDAATGKGEPATAKAIYFYLHNRLILPELLLQLDLLRAQRTAPALVEAVGEFLSLVTTFDGTESVGSISCKDVLADLNASASSEHFGLEGLLPRLDAKLQEITTLSAHALAAKT